MTCASARLLSTTQTQRPYTLRLATSYAGKPAEGRVPKAKFPKDSPIGNWKNAMLLDAVGQSKDAGEDFFFTQSASGY